MKGQVYQRIGVCGQPLPIRRKKVKVFLSFILVNGKGVCLQGQRMISSWNRRHHFIVRLFIGKLAGFSGSALNKLDVKVFFLWFTENGSIT